MLIKHYIFKSTEKYMITTHIPKWLNFLTFFSPSIRMSGKNGNFGDKKNLKSDFYKNKKVTKIDDIGVNKILVSKEEPYCTKNLFKYFIRFNDNYVIWPLCISFRKWLAMWENLKVIQQCPLRIRTNNC